MVLDQSGEERCLVYRQVGGALSKIAARRGLHTVESVPEIDLVQIHLEDLVLLELPFDVAGEDDLLELAAVGLVTRQEALPCQLLSDGAAALRTPAGFEIAHHRRRDPDRIHAAVLEKSLILDRDHRLDQVR
jgi:hypothetical protein